MNQNFHPADDKDKKDVPKLQSSTCRRLFWGSSDSPIPAELSMEAREEQKKRWNFDFMTETPLPGRYQWEKAGAHTPCNGDRKRSLSPTETQCPRPDKKVSQEDSSPKCQQPAEEVSPAYGVDCT